MADVMKELKDINKLLKKISDSLEDIDKLKSWEYEESHG